MRRVFICAAALVGLLSAACGDSSGPGNEVVIEMQDGDDFFPATATVSEGTRVRWRNVDNTAHNTTSNPAGLWASGNLNPGGTFARTFDIEGTFNYTCTLHPGMTGTITVNPRPIGSRAEPSSLRSIATLR